MNNIEESTHNPSRVLIGSSALKCWFPDFPRKPKDVDYAVASQRKSGEKGTEYLLNPILLEYCDTLVASPDELYTLKISHMFWDIDWEKHMFDIQFLKEKGCRLIPSLFEDLYSFWNHHHSKNKRSILAMTSEEFFDNAVKSSYPHDYIHTLLKNPPTYTKILKDGAEVDVDESKFKLLSFEEKCSLVREEVYVMAWERMKKLNYRVAYSKMLKKFIISHAPLWEAIFIIENFKFLHKPEFNYFKHIEKQLHKLENGKD